VQETEFIIIFILEPIACLHMLGKSSILLCV